MPVGRVKFFCQRRGFGFIQPDAHGADDVFVHLKELSRIGLQALEEGDRVSYTIVTNPRDGKPIAANIKLLETDAATPLAAGRGV
jgi:cold shock protein